MLPDRRHSSRALSLLSTAVALATACAVTIGAGLFFLTPSTAPSQGLDIVGTFQRYKIIALITALLAGWLVYQIMMVRRSTFTRRILEAPIFALYTVLAQNLYHTPYNALATVCVVFAVLICYDMFSPYVLG